MSSGRWSRLAAITDWEAGAEDEPVCGVDLDRPDEASREHCAQGVDVFHMIGSGRRLIQIGRERSRVGRITEIPVLGAVSARVRGRPGSGQT